MRALFACALVLCSASVARGDDDEADRDRIGRYHHKRAMNLLAERRIAEGVAELERGYEVSNASSFLYNLAQAFTAQAALETKPELAQSHRRRALYEWRMYLHVKPEAPERADIETTMAALERDMKSYDAAAEARMRDEAAGRRAAEAAEKARADEKARYDRTVEAERKQRARELRDMRTEFASMRQRHAEERAAWERLLDGERKARAGDVKKLADEAAQLQSENERLRQMLRDTARDQEEERGKVAEEKKSREERKRYGRPLLWSGIAALTVGALLLGAGYGLSPGRIDGQVRPDAPDGEELKAGGGILFGAASVVTILGGLLLSR